MTVQAQTLVNGVDVDQLVQTVEAIQSDPDLARFTFRAQTTWKGGGKSETKIQGFYGAGQEDTSRSQPFVLQGDEPSVLLGDNTGANAVESVLHALASCLSVGIAYNAAAQGIEVQELTFELEGDLDLHSFLGLSEQGRPGYDGIRIACHIRSNAPKEKVDELVAYVERTSPVLDIVRNPVPVDVHVS